MVFYNPCEHITIAWTDLNNQWLCSITEVWMTRPSSDFVICTVRRGQKIINRELFAPHTKKERKQKKGDKKLLFDRSCFCKKVDTSANRQASICNIPNGETRSHGDPVTDSVIHDTIIPISERTAEQKRCTEQMPL